MKSRSRQPSVSLNVAGLFSGIGGFELGLARAGHRTMLTCEIDPDACAVIDSKFDGSVVRVSDVRDLDELPPDIHLLTAGFPCQDLSQAGRTRGLRGKNSGLHKQVFRLIARSQPEFVLLENVPFMLHLRRGAAMRTILDRLEDSGYRWAYRVIDSRAFGLPQRRLRVFILASKTHDPAPYLLGSSSNPIERTFDGTQPCGFYWTEGNTGLGWAVDCVPTLKGGSGIGIPSPPAIWLGDQHFVVPDITVAERLQGFDANWTEGARARMRWKLVGNAVSVPVAEWIGRQIAAPPSGNVAPARILTKSDSLPNAAFGTDGERYISDASTWPTVTNYSLEVFLASALLHPLSLRAASGFLKRLRASGLRHPHEFRESLEAYVAAAKTGHSEKRRADDSSAIREADTPPVFSCKPGP